MHNPFGLYVVLTDPITGYENCAKAVINQGIQFLQLRIKNKSEQEITEIAYSLQNLTRGSDTLFVVNDSLKIAMQVDADGVHLGQDDMPIKEARAQWQKPNKIFGLSTHSEAQLAAAEKISPDYIGIGPVFPTPTKAIPDPDLGVERMGSMAKNTLLPSVAIGGIDEENLPAILQAGATNFCAVRAIMQSKDPEKVIARMMDVWRAHMKKINAQ